MPTSGLTDVPEVIDSSKIVSMTFAEQEMNVNLFDSIFSFTNRPAIIAAGGVFAVSIIKTIAKTTKTTTRV